MAAIELQNVVKRYGKVTAVHGIDLTVADGEFVVLVGPSGCGKSTTLRMIAGPRGDQRRHDPDRRAGGEPARAEGPQHRDGVPELRDLPAYERGQEHRLRPLHGEAAGGGEAQARRGDRAASSASEQLLERRPSELSGGQRQRVAIGRAMVRDPAAFLFDEPLSNLDAQLRAQMRLEIKRLHQRLGTTIVFVTHDQVEAMTMADRIVVMRDGRILQVGTPMELYERPADVFTARFIGSPTMNILPGALASRAAGAAVELGFGAPDRGAASAGRHGTGARHPRRGAAAGPRRPRRAGSAGRRRARGPRQRGRAARLGGVRPRGGGRPARPRERPAKALPPVGSPVRLGARAENVHLFDRGPRKRFEAAGLGIG